MQDFIFLRCLNEFEPLLFLKKGDVTLLVNPLCKLLINPTSDTMLYYALIYNAVIITNC